VDRCRHPQWDPIAVLRATARAMGPLQVAAPRTATKPQEAAAKVAVRVWDQMASPMDPTTMPRARTVATRTVVTRPAADSNRQSTGICFTGGGRSSAPPIRPERSGAADSQPNAGDPFQRESTGRLDQSSRTKSCISQTAADSCAGRSAASAPSVKFGQQRQERRSPTVDTECDRRNPRFICSKELRLEYITSSGFRESFAADSSTPFRPDFGAEASQFSKSWVRNLCSISGCFIFTTKNQGGRPPSASTRYRRKSTTLGFRGAGHCQRCS
jgi:hypothetical protein